MELLRPEGFHLTTASPPHRTYGTQKQDVNNRTIAPYSVFTLLRIYRNSVTLMSLKDNGNFELAVLMVSDPTHLMEALYRR